MKVVRLANYTSKVFERSDCVVWFPCYTRCKLNFDSYWIHYLYDKQCVKRVQIRSFFWSVFSWIRTKHGDLQMYRVRIQENTDQEKLRIWTLFTQWRSWKTLLTFLSCSFAIPWKVLWSSFRDLLQILLLTSSEFKQIN